MTSLKVVVNATDGYSWVVDKFDLNFNRLPFLYILTWILKLIGPLITVIGCIKYRVELHEILCKHRYTYSPDIVNVGK